MINGRLLPEPPNKIRRNYKIIYSIVHKSGLSFDKNNNKNNLSRLNEQRKYILRNKTISNIKDESNFKNLSSITGHNRLNDFQSNDFTIGPLIGKDLGLILNKTNNSKIGKLPKISQKEKVINRNIEDNKVNGIEDAYQDNRRNE